jgi:hypothetical protein
MDGCHGLRPEDPVKRANAHVGSADAPMIDLVAGAIRIQHRIQQPLFVKTYQQQGETEN